jgi:hypothetical protein
VDSEDVEFTGGEFGGKTIDKEADFAIGPDGKNARSGEGEGFGSWIEGFEGSGDEIGRGSDKEVGFDAFADPLVDGGTEAVDHDGDADGHGDGDGESGGGESVTVETAGEGGASENGGRKRQ